MDRSPEVRVHTSLLADVERRCLVWMAQRLPAGITSDHLTLLGAIGMLGSGACYAVAPTYPAALWGAVGMLVLNWFGDSLDGTVARVRHHERPRYGFYVDHVLDALGVLFLVAGLVLGGFMSLPVGAGFLIAYYLLANEIALATHALGVFRISYWKVGPTELRILLAIGTLVLLRSPHAHVFGTPLLLFDIGGVAGILALLATFLVSAARNTRTLFEAEPLPARDRRAAPPTRPQARTTAPGHW